MALFEQAEGWEDQFTIVNDGDLIGHVFPSTSGGKNLVINQVWWTDGKPCGRGASMLKVDSMVEAIFRTEEAVEYMSSEAWQKKYGKYKRGGK